MGTDQKGKGERRPAWHSENDLNPVPEYLWIQRLAQASRDLSPDLGLYLTNAKAAVILSTQLC